MMRVVCRTFLVLTLLLGLTAAPAMAAGGDVGTPAPGFDLQIYNAGTATLALDDLSGQVVLMFVVGYG